MDSEIFRAGVRPGAPNTSDEIKLLLCYVLSEVEEKMSFAQLNEALQEHELVNYFELISALDSLSVTGHISASEKGGGEFYAITELGRSTAATIETLLPKATRDKASRAAKKMLKRERRKREVEAEILELKKGFEVKLAFPRGESVLSMTVFCPTIEEARLVRRRFLNDPAFIYKGTLALLTGDAEVLGKVFPSGEEELF
jgi:DNA-binding PadR family transcriptional regulator